MEGLVSIITPTFNSEAFIIETIRSVQEQTYQNWELIIVDDCSKDRTVEFIQGHAMKDQRIHLLLMDCNGGPAQARNKGINFASGKYMTFLDADDLWFPEFIVSSIKNIIKY